MAELKDNLLARGYKEESVDQQLRKVMSIPRTETLQPHPRQHQSIKRVPLVITYHPALSRITKSLRKHLDILHVSDRLKAAIPDPPIVAFRRPHNLRDLLVRAKLKKTNPPTQTGSTGTTHKTRSTFTCKTRNLVYLIQCRKCGLQYVGETANPLHIRMNGHRSDIHTQKTDKPVAAHFNLPDHTLDDLQVMGIKKIHNNDTEWRKHRESYWIFTLDTLAPTGMNLED